MSAVTPIEHAVRPEKQGARRHYGSHPYFTKRAWNVVQEYVKRFSKPGDTVLDPFGGSGVTAVESLVLRRKAIYLDISEWACFLARQTAIAPTDLGLLKAAFGSVEDAARPYIEELWKSDHRALRRRPVQDWYPAGQRLPSNADVETVEELFTPRMLHGLARLRAAILDVRDLRSRDLLLMAFSATLARINRTFLSTTNRAESRGGSAIFSIYRYKVAADVIELPLWDQFARRVSRLLDAKRETNLLIGDFFDERQTARFIHGSATRLDAHVPPESIDYIYTDPPYGGNIAYLDLSMMWSAWLGFQISLRDRSDEVIEGGELRKSREVYEELLAASLHQMATALKPGRWLSVVFAHRDTAYWDTLVNACAKAGLDYQNTVVQPVAVVWSMHKKKNPLRVLSGELVLNFRKTGGGERRRRPLPAGDPLQLVLATCENSITQRHGCTTEELHHAVIPVLLEHGALAKFGREHGDLTPILRAHFDFDAHHRRWHLQRDQPPFGRVPAEQLAAYHAVRTLSRLRHANIGLTEAEFTAELNRRLAGKKRLDAANVRRLLRRIGYSPDGRHWRVRQDREQLPLQFTG